MNGPGRPGGPRLLEQAGGISGLIYSSLPVLVFVPVSSRFGLPSAVVTAVLVAAAVLLWRLFRRDSTQPAFSGFFGVAVCAVVAYAMGEAKGYFLLGIWMSLLWAIGFAVSVLVRRPAVGYLWSWLSGHDRGWRQVRRAVWVFDLATLAWVAVFSSRFVVQRLLYNAGETGWLGVARISMGWPLTAVAALITYLAVKAVRRLLDTEFAAADPVPTGSAGA